MSRLFRLNDVSNNDPEVQNWLDSCAGELGVLARYWFEKLRQCGVDVNEALHDGHPTACVKDVAFAYVNAFTLHVNLGFFHGAELPDPHEILQGSGKLMRHVKLRPGEAQHDEAISNLIEAAYQDLQNRLQ